MPNLLCLIQPPVVPTQVGTRMTALTIWQRLDELVRLDTHEA